MDDDNTSEFKRIQLFAVMCTVDVYSDVYSRCVQCVIMCTVDVCSVLQSTVHA